MHPRKVAHEKLLDGVIRIKIKLTGGGVLTHREIKTVGGGAVAMTRLSLLRMALAHAERGSSSSDAGNSVEGRSGDNRKAEREFPWGGFGGGLGPAAHT
jgi:hypothetical protein